MADVQMRYVVVTVDFHEPSVTVYAIPENPRFLKEHYLTTSKPGADCPDWIDFLSKVTAKLNTAAAARTDQFVTLNADTNEHEIHCIP
jgi:hypothetical protein